MKRLIHIAVKVLTAYFIALPILFGCHTIQHEHDYVVDLDDGLEYAKYAPDCALCDLYHSQTATVDAPYFNAIRLQWISFQPPIAVALPDTYKDLIFYRGPPTA